MFLSYTEKGINKKVPFFYAEPNLYLLNKNKNIKNEEL